MSPPTRPGLIASLPIVALPWAAAPEVAVSNPGFEDISGESPFNELTFGPLNGWWESP